MLIHTLALSALLFVPPTHALATPEVWRPAQTQAEKTQETESLLAEIVKIEAAAKATRNFKGARSEYGKFLERVAELHKKGDSTVQFPTVLEEFIASLLVVTHQQGELSPNFLVMLRQVGPEETFPKNKELTEIWNTAFDLAAKSARVLSITEQGSKAPESEDPLTDAVKHFMAIGQHDNIVQLGRRAVPALEQAVLDNLDQLATKRAHDALVTLARVDDIAAFRLVMENIDRGGTLWRFRILRLFERESPYVAITPSSAWQDRVKRPYKLTLSHWLETLERLTTFEDIRRDLIQVFADGRLHSELTPKLVDFLQLALLSKERDVRQEVMMAFRNRPLAKQALSLVHAGAKSGEEDIRVWAADHLAVLTPSPELLELGEDPSVAVRTVVARSLADGLRYDQELRDSPFVRLGSQPGELELLQSYLMDPDREIRHLAARQAAELENFQVPEEALLALLRETDPHIVDLASRWISQLSPQLRLREMKRLVSAPDQQLLMGPDQRLFSDHETFTPNETLELTRARLDNPADSFWQNAARSTDLLRHLALADDGIAQICEWARVKPQILEVATKQGWVLEVDPPTFGRLIEAAAKNNQRFHDLRKLAMKRNAVRYDPNWLAFANQGEQDSIIFRLLAMETAARSLPSETVETFRRLVDEVVNGVSMDWLPSMIEDVPAAPRNAMIRILLENPSFPLESKGRIAREYEPKAAGAAQVQQWVLEDYAKNGNDTEKLVPGKSTVAKALKQMATNKDSVRPELLLLAIQDGTLHPAARETIIALRDPSYLERLRDVLRKPAPFDAHASMIDAVQSFMSDEAAEILIEAAGFLGDADLRKRALDRVEGIREYQDAAARWSARKTERLDRDAVLSELLELLENGTTEIRVEAIRGLGTFEAAEHLPRLIRLLSDDAEPVRNAAREAIDRIHAGAEAEQKD